MLTFSWILQPDILAPSKNFMNSELASGLQGRVMLLPWLGAGMGGGRGRAGMTAVSTVKLATSELSCSMVVSTPVEMGWSPAASVDWGWATSDSALDSALSTLTEFYWAMSATLARKAPVRIASGLDGTTSGIGKGSGLDSGCGFVAVSEGGNKIGACIGIGGLFGLRGLVGTVGIWLSSFDWNIKSPDSDVRRFAWSRRAAFELSQYSLAVPGFFQPNMFCSTWWDAPESAIFVPAVWRGVCTE